jgi:hypothetical protein
LIAKRGETFKLTKIFTGTGDEHRPGLNSFKNCRLNGKQWIRVGTMTTIEPERVSRDTILQKGSKRVDSAGCRELFDFQADALVPEPFQ